MAERILSKPAVGEERTLQELARDVPEVAGKAVPSRKPLEVSERSTRSAASNEAEHEEPQTVAALTGQQHHLSEDEKIVALQRIVAQEESRIASLKDELDKLKAAKASSGNVAHDIGQEVEQLAKDIEGSKEDLAHIREHVRDLQELKQEVKEGEESQEEADEMHEQAESVKEHAGQQEPE